MSSNYLSFNKLQHNQISQKTKTKYQKSKRSTATLFCVNKAAIIDDKQLTSSRFLPLTFRTFKKYNRAVYIY